METKSSMAISRVQQTNYSALSNLPRSVINQIKREGEIYLLAPQRCHLIWTEMRRTDFTSGAQLTFKIVDALFDKFKEDFNQLLKLQNSKVLFDLFDQDNDGCLNEDEQILIFSVIKEKMSLVANQLLKIQEYIQFKQLMKEVRTLEASIAQYQNELRQKIYKREVQIYGEIGQEKLDDFYDKYYELFQQLEDYKKMRRQIIIKPQRQQTTQVQNEEYLKLDERLSKDTELLKIKPKKKLKDLQTQEKLVSLDERVEEALDFRRELREMEKYEQQRVHNVQQQHIQKQHEDVEKKHAKEREQLELKLIEHEHKLIIQMKKDYDVLLKKINLHSNEIERIQGLATKNAIKKGKDEGELKRTKNRAKLQNNIIGQTKEIKTIPEIHNEQEEEDDEKRKIRRRQSNMSGSPAARQLNRQGTMSDGGSQYGTSTNFSQQSVKMQQNINHIKKIIKSKNLTQFYIRKKYGADLPVNFQSEPHQVGGDNHERIEKFLMAKKKSPLDILPSLTELYDAELNVISLGNTHKSDQEILKERMQKRNFINEKLQNGDDPRKLK